MELEILEKKLQLQRMMLRCPEVLRIPPVKPTPLHGCFKDHTRNHQDFATLETLRTRQNSTAKLPLLPHYLVMTNKGMSEYQPLNISEFVCGYIEKVKPLSKDTGGFICPFTTIDRKGHELFMELCENLPSRWYL